MAGLFDRTHLRIWLAIVGVGSLVLAASYAMVQQSSRLAANDTPLASAQRIEHQLAAGAVPNDVVPQIKTDLRKDITSFAIITDSGSNVLASSAQLDGQTPLPPAGVFSYAKSHGTDHVTWQPTSGVRIAMLIQPYSAASTSGFIITGQSLKNVEDRTAMFGQVALAAWLSMVALATLLLLTTALTTISPKPSNSRSKR